MQSRSLDSHISADSESQVKFLESILLHIPHMVFVKEAKELRFVLFNKAGEELLGVKNSDLLGKNDYDFFPKDQADHFVAADRRVLSGQKMVMSEEEPIDSPARGRRYLRTKKVPILDATGEPLFLIGISEDITETKASQKTIEDQRQALVLSSKLSSLGEMAGGIAHEINNPLGIIQGLSGMLRILARKEELTAEKVGEIANRIDGTVKRISHIITTMRGIARDGSKDIKITCDLGQIIKDTLSLCKEKFAVGNVNIRVTGAADVFVHARPTEISQVILNLLHNAYDAVMDCSEKWINVDVSEQKERVVVAVTDSGAGVPLELRDKVMQPFFTTKQVGKGTGLGLSISRSIIEGHSGNLRLVGEGKHACFTFDLEKADRETLAAEAS